VKTTQLLILFIAFALIIVFCSFLSGCASAIEAEQKIADQITAIDDKTHSVLGIVTTSGQVLHFVSELHKAGVDKEVLLTIQDAMHKVHDIAEKEHQKHVQRE